MSHSVFLARSLPLLLSSSLYLSLSLHLSPTLPLLQSFPPFFSLSPSFLSLFLTLSLSSYACLCGSLTICVWVCFCVRLLHYVCVCVYVRVSVVFILMFDFWSFCEYLRLRLCCLFLQVNSCECVSMCVCVWCSLYIMYAMRRSGHSLIQSPPSCLPAYRVRNANASLSLFFFLSLSLSLPLSRARARTRALSLSFSIIALLPIIYLFERLYVYISSYMCIHRYIQRDVSTKMISICM